MLVRRVIDDEFANHADAAGVRRGDEIFEFGKRSVIRAHLVISGDVVAVVLSGRRIEGEKPDSIHPEAVDIIELGVKAGEIADAVVVGVEKRFDVQLIDDRILVPERILGELRLWSTRHPSPFSDSPNGEGKFRIEPIR